jgi:hypothetical protein
MHQVIGAMLLLCQIQGSSSFEAKGRRIPPLSLHHVRNRVSLHILSHLGNACLGTRVAKARQMLPGMKLQYTGKFIKCTMNGQWRGSVGPMEENPVFDVTHLGHFNCMSLSIPDSLSSP